MIKKCENYENLGLKIKNASNISSLLKKILLRFASFCISLIFTYCLFVEKELWTIKIFLLDFFGGPKKRDKMAISAYILEKSGKGPIFQASYQS